MYLTTLAKNNEKLMKAEKIIEFFLGVYRLCNILAKIICYAPSNDR